MTVQSLKRTPFAVRPMVVRALKFLDDTFWGTVPAGGCGGLTTILVGIAALQPAHLQPGGPSEAGGSSTSVHQYPFAVVCAIATEYDPREAHGFGGQLAVQNGAVVNHHLRAYMRELGYRASIGGADAVSVATAAGLGTLDKSGRFVTGMRAAHIHVADAILADLPLAPDAPQK